MDHGLTAEDLSFVLSERTSSAPVMDAAGMPRIHSVEAAPPPSISIRGDDALTDVRLPQPPPMPLHTLPLSEDVQKQEVGSPASYHYDALGSVIPSTPNVAYAGATETLSPNSTVLPGDISLETAEHDRRSEAHIIDMNRELPNAATGISTTTGGDAAKGALEGAGIGIGLGIVLGLATLFIPGVGLVAGAGALVAGLAAATGAAGGIAGGVYGYLVDMGLPPDTAKHLSEHLEAGEIILCVQVRGDIPTDEIESLLRKYHATSSQAY